MPRPTVRHLTLAGIAFMAVASGITACHREKPLVRIAVAGPLTGDVAPLGLGIKRSVELALSDAGGLDDLPFRVEIASYDDRAEPDAAVQLARIIAADPTVAVVIGHLTSGCSIAAARVYAAAGLAMMTPAATSPEVTLQQTKPDWIWPRVVLRIPTSDAVLGDFAAQYAYDRFNLRRMAVVNDGTPYGHDLAEAFRQRFLAKGGAALPMQAIARGDRDFSALLSGLAPWRPDGLFFGGLYTEFGLILVQARAQGLSIPFIAGDGAKAQELFSIAGSAAEGAYIAMGGMPLEETPSATDFIESYRKRFNAEPQVYDHYAHEAGAIALECLRRVGPERGKMIDCLRSSQHSGMLGTIMFDSKGDTLKNVPTMTRADPRQKRFLPRY
jgi:branched-chain amino acid transport system substrate-binding protein